MEYTTIVSDDEKLIEASMLLGENVNELLRDGWELFGEAQVAMTSMVWEFDTKLHFALSQTMVRKTED